MRKASNKKLDRSNSVKKVFQVLNGRTYLALEQLKAVVEIDPSLLLLLEVNMRIASTKKVRPSHN